MGYRANGHRDLSYALIPPLLVRLLDDGIELAPSRIGLCALAFIVAQAWRVIFAGGRLRLLPEAGQFSFALLFAVMLPSSVGWGSALLAASFGWVFGREIFGGKSVFSPALVALAFAIFSFPQIGYEAQAVFSMPINYVFALACLPGGAWLLWQKIIYWQTVAGALVATAVVSLFISTAAAPVWWEHYFIGGFSAGVMFLLAAPESNPGTQSARWLHGAFVGALIVVIRQFDPAQPDGVVFAALLGALFAPLFDRALSWKAARA